jgi:hypothetical protein
MVFRLAHALEASGRRPDTDRRGSSRFPPCPVWGRPPTPSLYVTSDPRVLAVTLAAATGIFVADRYLLDSNAVA